MASRFRSRNIAFMACPREDFSQLVHDLTTAIDPSGGWELMCFYAPPLPLPAGTFATLSVGAFGAAVRLIAEMLVRPAVNVVVCCHDLTDPAALTLLLQFVGILRAHERLLIDVRRNRHRITRSKPAVVLALMAVSPLLALSALITRAGLKIWKSDELPSARAACLTKAMVLPVLPDLSHTFVYREVAALKRLHPDYLILSLEKGDSSVLHREALELLPQTETIPRPSATRYLVWYLRAWLTRPSAMAGLIRYFQPHTASFGEGWIANDALCFLRVQHLYNSNYLMLGFVLAEYLRTRKVGYVHVYGSTYPSLRMLVAHRLLGIPYSISTFVDFEYQTPLHMLGSKFGEARFVVACTHFCAGRLAERLPTIRPSVRVLHHALPANFANGMAMRPRDGRSRVVYVGRFVAKKGLDTLVRACHLLHERGIDFTCHLYGDGPERPALEGLIGDLRLANCVYFEGAIPNQRFYQAMNRDDVFVCPSRYMPDGERDGIPVTLLEAMAAGVTVVATPISGIPELIVDRQNGYLVPPEDPVRLADLLQMLLTVPERRDAVEVAAMSTVRSNFSLERTSETLDSWIIRETASATETVPPETSATGQHA